MLRLRELRGLGVQGFRVWRFTEERAERFKAQLPNFWGLYKVVLF